MSELRHNNNTGERASKREEKKVGSQNNKNNNGHGHFHIHTYICIYWFHKAVYVLLQLLSNEFTGQEKNEAAPNNGNSNDKKISER